MRVKRVLSNRELAALRRLVTWANEQKMTDARDVQAIRVLRGFLHDGSAVPVPTEGERA